MREASLHFPGTQTGLENIRTKSLLVSNTKLMIDAKKQNKEEELRAASMEEQLTNPIHNCKKKVTCRSRFTRRPQSHQAKSYGESGSEQLWRIRLRENSSLAEHGKENTQTGNAFFG